jgi:hypothetical protein
MPDEFERRGRARRDKAAKRDEDLDRIGMVLLLATVVAGLYALAQVVG